MKKALYITNLGLMDNLGMTQILPYITGLAERGIGLRVLSYEKKENLENKSKIRDVENRLKLHAIKWTALRYHNRWGNLYDILAGFFIVTALIFRDRTDIIHARASIPIILGWPIARLSGRKIIYDRRGTMKGDFIDDVNLENIFSLKFLSDILGKIDKFFMGHSDAVVVLSERSKELLKKNELAGKEKVVCDSIPCCVDMNRFKQRNGQTDEGVDLRGKFVVAYAGSLGTCYLLNEMIDFFKALKETNKNAFFLIITHSDGQVSRSCFSNKRIACQDYAIVDVGPDEVSLWLRKCACSVMFIKEVECKIGSSPTKFAESLASGVPVIINKGIGDTEEIVCVNRIGCLVESLDDEGYRRALSCLGELLKDEAALKKRCKDVAGRFFSMELGIEKYEGIYNHIYEREVR